MTHIQTHSNIVLGALIAWMGIIIARLGYVQIYHHATYTELAQQQSHMTLYAMPERGRIYDRHGVPLVHNQHRYALCAAPAECNDFTRLREYIERHFPDRLPALDAAPHAHFLYIRRHPSDADLQAISDDPISDIFFIQEPQRKPIDPAIQPIIGATDSDNHGISGLEYYWNDYLKGHSGIYHLYRDARSHHLHFKKYIIEPYVPGDDIYTTIDSTLQFLVHRVVEQHTDHHKATAGTALIMDPKTGDIHALAQTSHNPSESVIPITQTYELGSVIKVFLMAAALDSNTTTPDTPIWCDNTRNTYINGMPISTWRAEETLPFADVIRFSNNIGTAKTARRMGKQLYTYYRNFKLGETTGIDFPGEQAGFMTHPRHWSRASPLSLSFGYEVSISLLQLARSFSLFANNGWCVQPRFTQYTPSTWYNTHVSQHTVDQSRDIISIDTMGNTARRGQIPGYAIYGKTGSARLITNGTYDHTRGIYTFVGLVENGSYQRIIVTCIKEPHGQNIYAATVAVPLFKTIAQEMLLHDHQIQGDTYVSNNSS